MPTLTSGGLLPAFLSGRGLSKPLPLQNTAGLAEDEYSRWLNAEIPSFHEHIFSWSGKGPPPPNAVHVLNGLFSGSDSGLNLIMQLKR